MTNFHNPLEYKNDDSDLSPQNMDGHYINIDYLPEAAVSESSEQDDANDDDVKVPTDGKLELKEKHKRKESQSSEHDGKFLIIQKGKACCDKGSKFPNFKVDSHKKHYWNDEAGDAGNLAVTEDDLNFNPPSVPFGTCSIKNGNPCAFAPAGKWTKTYENIKIMGKKPLTELSELMCAVGGKITVMKHGQQSEAGKSSVASADKREQQTYNPIMDFGEFGEEINQSDQHYYE